MPVRSRTLFIVTVVAAVGLCLPAHRAVAAATTPVMLLDGESGGPWHKWQLTTPALKKALEDSGLFTVDVVTAPPAGGDFSTFAPEWKKYRAIVWNYDAPDARWPDALKKSFEEYVGGRWRRRDRARGRQRLPGVDRVQRDDRRRRLARPHREGRSVLVREGRRKTVSDPSPGPAGAHGARVPFLVTVRAPSHPITRGLPATWMHQGDELYSKLRGPGKNMTILATAHSSPDNAGSDRDEPMLMALTWGKGRIFHTTLGHDVNGMSCVGFVVTLQRGTEWAATGAVTQKVPATFPTPTTVSYRADLAALDPNFKKGLNGLDK